MRGSKSLWRTITTTSTILTYSLNESPQICGLLATYGHLYFINDPDEYGAAIAPPKSSAGLEARKREAAIRDNSGLTKMEILPGNIRYVKIGSFEWSPRITAAAYDSAAQFVKDADAMIVDLRGNGGGVSDAADYFHVLRMANKPLYILVDGHVASAAEQLLTASSRKRVARSSEVRRTVLQTITRSFPSHRGLS